MIILILSIPVYGAYLETPSSTVYVGLQSDGAMHGKHEMVVLKKSNKNQSCLMISFSVRMRDG